MKKLLILGAISRFSEKFSKFLTDFENFLLYIWPADKTYMAIFGQNWLVPFLVPFWFSVVLFASDHLAALY